MVESNVFRQKKNRIEKGKEPINRDNKKESESKVKKVLLEIVLILSGVLVFRSLWTLMDKFSFLNKAPVHVVFLIVGLALSIYALYKLME